MTRPTRWALPALLILAALPARAQYNPAQTIAPAFFDISTQTGNGLGTQIAAAEADDAISAAQPVPAGFTVSYFGVAATTFQVSSNGWMSFNSTGTASGAGNNLMPSTVTPNGVIAPFWEDLDNDDNGTNLVGSNAEVDYYYDAANSRLIVQWTNFRRYTGAAAGQPGALTFQAQIYSSGVIEYHYATMTDPGLGYTVGLENGTGTIGHEYVVNGVSPLPAGGGTIRSNMALRYTLATGPLPLANTTQFNFLAVAGGCSGFSRTIGITVTNVGVGNLTFTSGTLTGSSAFTIAAPQTSAGVATTFPVVLAPGTSFRAAVGYFPSATQTGPQTATATFASDGGSVVLPVSGSGSPQGAGYVYQASTAPTGCAVAGTVAPGTAFVPVAGHTRITAWTTGTGDDGRFTLPLASLAGFPSVRWGGADATTLYVQSNAIVSTSSVTPGTTGTNYGANTLAANAVEVAAMNLTTAVTGDAAGVAGEPGVYYGTSDVDGNGTQELVVTYWHAYDFGSAPGPAGQYLTAQLVIYRGARANEEAAFEVRFPDGLDANGVAYRQNTGVADSGTDVSIENDALTAVTEANGIESATYRFRNGTAGAGAIFAATPLYTAGGGSTAARFTPEVQAVATGQAGWRMMGVPVRSVTVARLAALNLVQSVVGQYPTFASDNVFAFDGTAYVPAVSTADALTPGRGFLWYLFNQAFTPNPAADGGGTSVSYTLPMALQAVGAEPATTLNAYPLLLTTTGGGFNLLANPVRDDLDLSGVASWPAAGGTLASAVPQVWDPNAGGSGSYAVVTGSVSAWQGFFLQNRTDGTGATSVTIPSTARNTAGTFLGRSGALYSNDRLDTAAREAGPTVAFELAGTDAATGRPTLDRAATLAFDADGTAGWDLYDASKLAPLASAFATVGFQGVGPDGQAAVKAQESRPLAAASFDVPLVVDAAGTAPALALSWAGLDALPATWAVELRDVVTGATVDMRAQASYSFEHAADAALALAPEALMARTTTAAQAKAAAAPRFVLHVTTGRTTAGESDAVTAFALAAPSPNPTAGSAVVSFDVPSASDVSVSVYDLLGRRVAVLAQGETAAGRHAVRLDAGALAPGVYVVRMQAGTFMATQRVTVVR